MTATYKDTPDKVLQAREYEWQEFFRKDGMVRNGPYMWMLSNIYAGRMVTIETTMED